MEIRRVLSEKTKAYLIMGFCVFSVLAVIAVPYFITLSNGFESAETSNSKNVEQDKGESLIANENEENDNEEDQSETVNSIETDITLTVATSDKTPATSQVAQPSQNTTGQVQNNSMAQEATQEDKINIDDRTSNDSGYTEMGPIANTDASAGIYIPGEAEEPNEDDEQNEDEKQEESSGGNGESENKMPEEN